MNARPAWHLTLEGAAKVRARADACRSVGLVEQAAKHDDRARRLKLWAEVQMLRGRVER